VGREKTIKNSDSSSGCQLTLLHKFSCFKLCFSLSSRGNKLQLSTVLYATLSCYAVYEFNRC